MHAYIDQYITLGASVCNSTNCYENTDEHYASFLIFSYPNSTDVDINLINILNKTNEEITKISFNLEENTFIENNLFGYVFKGIKIISYPNNIQLISTKSNLSIVINNNTLSKNENFTLSFNSNDIYEINNYIIEYALIITEGDYDESNKLISYKKNLIYEENYESIEKEIFIGKSSYYNIIIEKELTTKNCNNNICSLCLSIDKTNCITCKSSYHFEDNKKLCDDNETLASTLPIMTSIPSIITTIFSTSLTSSLYSDKDIIASTLPILTSIPSVISNIISTSLSSSLYSDYSTYSSLFSTIPINTEIDTYTTIPLINSKDSINPIISSKPLISTTSPSLNSILIEKYECSKEEILNNDCKDGKMDDKQIEDIHKDLKENLNEFNKTNKIILTKNVVFQISTIDQQKNNLLSNISSIDLGECEKKIKQNINGLSENNELIIIKTDIKDEETKSTFVQYEIYNPCTFEEIDLNICENEISISVPVYLDKNIEDIHEKLNNYGYNLFNQNDSFYNDICTKYTTENETDLTLIDRRNDIYCLVNNLSLCQKGCNFKYYNSTTKKAKCNCNTQEKKNFISNIKEIHINFFSKENIINIFSKGLINSNFMVLKCYKLALSIKDHIYNYGCIIMTLLFLLFIIFMIKYCIKDQKLIYDYIQAIISQCFPLYNNYYNRIERRKRTSNNNNFKIMKETNKKKIYSKKSSKKSIGDIFKNVKDKKHIKKSNYVPPKRKRKKEKVSSKNENDSIQRLKVKSLTINNLFLNKSPMSQIIQDNIRKFSKNKTTKQIKNAKNINKKKQKHMKDKSPSILKLINKYNESKDDINKNRYKKLNDQELNTLEYNLAIKLDKRNYFQYYCSLLKKKHLIIFSFIPIDDYNILSLKISLFLMIFSLYFTVNGFFFNDDTMHDIYKSNGTFNIINQISIILYSSLISTLIQQILKLLCLSENSILKIKKENQLMIAMKKSRNIEKCLKIKFIIFYIFSFLLIIFCWYFITCFCAVYQNTQIILIKDTFISFAISMIYPFCINFIPGLFRIPALRDLQKDKKCIYKFRLFVALF